MALTGTYVGVGVVATVPPWKNVADDARALSRPPLKFNVPVVPAMEVVRALWVTVLTRVQASVPPVRLITATLGVAALRVKSRMPHSARPPLRLTVVVPRLATSHVALPG